MAKRVIVRLTIEVNEKYLPYLGHAINTTLGPHGEMLSVEQVFPILPAKEEGA